MKELKVKLKERGWKNGLMLNFSSNSELVINIMIFSYTFFQGHNIFVIYIRYLVNYTSVIIIHPYVIFCIKFYKQIKGSKRLNNFTN